MLTSFSCAHLPGSLIREPGTLHSRKKPPGEWTDTRLVKECLAGNEDAWSALVDKYKALIFSIPIKYQMPPQEAADIFQSVCMELLASLPNLREPKALPAWLMQVAHHRMWPLETATTTHDQQ